MEMHDVPFWSLLSVRFQTQQPVTAPILEQYPMRKSPGENLDITTPKFIVESDATIVAPLIFAYILDL
jgi:deoxyhypusine synthase